MSVSNYYVTIKGVKVELLSNNGFYNISLSNGNRIAFSKVRLIEILMEIFGITKEQAEDYASGLD